MKQKKTRTKLTEQNYARVWYWEDSERQFTRFDFPRYTWDISRTGTNSLLIQKFRGLGRILDPKRDPVLREDENGLSVVVVGDRRVASVENTETSVVSLCENSWNRVLEFLGRCIYGFRQRRFGGLEQPIDHGSERTIDFRNFSFPIVFTG